jgi:light-regulated signal transduction histidine kinase (bacteriophytochrome)
MQKITLLVETLKKLDINETEKNELLALANAIQKEQAISDFKTNRLEKDKIIAVNLLEASVEDLNRQNIEIKAKNALLELQTQEIEAKNKTLQLQQQQLEATTKQLRENLRSLEISYEELENFSFIASHDLKTPLRSITSFAQLLAKKYNHLLDEDALNYLHFIVQGVNKMNNTVDDLIGFFKLNNKDAKFLDTDLNDIVKNVLANLAQQISDKKAVILMPELPVLHIYKNGIIHLFENLLDNALKFSKEDETPIIEIKVQNEGNIWQFSVQDNGLGLDESYQKKAFQPFQRISNLENPGTGMGLAICKKVAQMHGGDIWYQSKIGEGSVFSFTIEQKNFN